MDIERWRARKHQRRSTFHFQVKVATPKGEVLQRSETQGVTRSVIQPLKGKEGNEGRRLHYSTNNVHACKPHFSRLTEGGGTLVLPVRLVRIAFIVQAVGNERRERQETKRC